MNVFDAKNKGLQKKTLTLIWDGFTVDSQVMGKLTFDNGKFYFTAKCDAEIKAARFWTLKKDADTLQWVTRNPHKAVGLRRFADQIAEQKFKNYFITDFAPPEQIIYPDHLSPRLHQIETAWHCLTRSPSYNADEAGLGKTIESILCMNTVPGKTLIICPPHLVHNWINEIEKWHITTPLSSIGLAGTGDTPDAVFEMDIVIIPDSLLIVSNIQAKLKAHQFTWLFVDEAHRYKEATTQRTKVLIDAITPQAQRVCYLSSTPFPNGRPIELYPLLSGTAPESILWRGIEQYGKAFCNAKRVTRYEGPKAIVNWDFSGACNLKRLRRELRAKLMIRHLKRDCLKELPPKTRKFLFLDSPTRLKPFEKAALKNRSLDELLGEDHDAGDLATYRREVGQSKITPAFIILNEWLESNPGKKCVVFAHHIEVVENLARLLSDYQPIMIRGGLSKKEKAKRVALFQSVQEHRVAIGNMEAMGTGNTMTAAEDAFVVEGSYVPGINEQAEDRLHRMTQLGIVYIRYLVLRGSLDERLLYRCLEKQDAISQVMD